jgi:hypothetical protein
LSDEKNYFDAHYIYWCRYGVSIKKCSFILIRVMQTGMIAAVIPLVISTFTNDGGGGTTLGFLNSGRFVGNALGPMLATTTLAQFGLLPLYLAISTLAVAMLVGFLSFIKYRPVQPT